MAGMFKIVAIMVIMGLFLCSSGCICCGGADSLLIGAKKPVASVQVPASLKVSNVNYLAVYQLSCNSPDKIKDMLAGFMGIDTGTNSSDVVKSMALSAAVDVSGMRGLTMAVYMENSPEAQLLSTALNNSSPMLGIPTDLSTMPGFVDSWNMSYGDPTQDNPAADGQNMDQWMSGMMNGTSSGDIPDISSLDPSMFGLNGLMNGTSSGDIPDISSLDPSMFGLNDPMSGDFGGLGLDSSSGGMQYAAVIYMELSSPTDASMGYEALKQGFIGGNSVDEGSVNIGDGGEKYYLAEAGQHILIYRYNTVIVIVLSDLSNEEDAVAYASIGAIKVVSQ